MKLTEQRLVRYLEESLDLEDVEADSELFSSGWLDSVSMLELIAFVEREAGIEVTPDDVTLANFDTVSRMLRFATGRAA